MSYKQLARDVRPGARVLVADGALVLRVLSADSAAGTVTARCESTATLGERKNVNLPGVVVDLPTITPRDEEDIVGFGLRHGVDCLALSFVRSAADVAAARRLLRGRAGEQVKVLCKARGAAASLESPPVHAASFGADRGAAGNGQLRRNPGRVGWHHGGPRRPGHGDCG